MKYVVPVVDPQTVLQSSPLTRAAFPVQALRWSSEESGAPGAERRAFGFGFRSLEAVRSLMTTPARNKAKKRKQRPDADEVSGDLNSCGLVPLGPEVYPESESLEGDVLCFLPGELEPLRPVS